MLFACQIPLKLGLPSAVLDHRPGKKVLIVGIIVPTPNEDIAKTCRPTSTGYWFLAAGRALSFMLAAVHLHGLAGDVMRESVGEHSLVATDLLRGLPEAFRRTQNAIKGRLVCWGG